MLAESGGRIIQPHPGNCRTLVLYLIAGLTLAAGSARADEAVDRGHDLAAQHCSRCHTVDPDRPFTGIGSTPSFALLASLDDWRERAESFFARPPHPPVVRLPGIEPPTDDPPTTAPFEITIENIDDLIAYFESLRVE